MDARTSDGPDGEEDDASALPLTGWLSGLWASVEERVPFNLLAWSVEWREDGGLLGWVGGWALKVVIEGTAVGIPVGLGLVILGTGLRFVLPASFGTVLPPVEVGRWLGRAMLLAWAGVFVEEWCLVDRLYHGEAAYELEIGQ